MSRLNAPRPHGHQGRSPRETNNTPLPIPECPPTRPFALQVGEPAARCERADRHDRPEHDMTATDTAAALRALALEFTTLADALDAARDGKPADQLASVRRLLGALYDGVLPRLLDVETWGKQVTPKLQ